MELRALAEAVLLGGTLADKLRAPTEPLQDEAPGEARAVAEPARAGALRWRPEEAEVPPATRLEEPRRRAALLHAFANHELLATELFAHALLRWPDAPAGFRRGLAQTLLDEQRHLGLYVARLEALGVPFGELPLNRYLWDAMAAVPDPPTFVAVMALTFEQANLDHMRSTAQALRAVGDEASAAILDQIGREEVQHVALGLRWFERWRVRSAETWPAYVAALPEPLTPRRARGDTVWEAPRLEAGLSPEFVRELKVYSSSRGRPGRLVWFDPACELRWSGAALPPAAAALERDLAGVLVALCRADDVLLAPRPSLAHLEVLQRAGFALPEFADAPPARRLGEALPWGWTPAALERARGLELQTPPPDLAGWGACFAKPWAAALWRELPEVEALGADPAALPRVCRTWDEVAAALAACPGRGVVKAPYGASGRGQLRSDGPPWEPGFQAWVQGVLERQGPVLVQPWLARLGDLSCLLEVDAQGTRVLGVTRFRTDRRGQYLGHDLGALDADLDPALRRALHGAPQRLLRGLEALGRAAGERLRQAGYRGPAGLDVLLTRRGDAPALVPLELNPRHTFGHVALALGPRLVPGRGGAFVLAAREPARAALEAAPARFAARGGALRLEAGVLALTDPARAERWVALLAAAASPAEAWALVPPATRGRVRAHEEDP